MSPAKKAPSSSAGGAETTENTEQMGPAPASPALVTALRRLLRPLVHLLVVRGITFPFLYDLLKRVYVDVADRDFRQEGKAQTVSRVSVLSGVHRKDVRRFLDEGTADADVPRAVSLGARLVSTWMAERRWLDGQGKPKSLPRLREGRRLSFEDLVEDVHRQDVRPRVVLDELKRLGVVRVDDDDVVHLETGALVPSSDDDEMAYYFGRNLRDHIAASAHNVAGAKPPFPERALYYDGLSVASAQRLRELALERGMDMLQELNREAARLAKRDAKGDDKAQRITVGFFYWGGRDDGDDGAS